MASDDKSRKATRTTSRGAGSKARERDDEALSRQTTPPRTLVLVPVLRGRPESHGDAGSEGAAARSRVRMAPHSPESRLAEATGLAQAIDLPVANALLVPVPQPRPATLFGSGKVEELKALIAAEEIGLVVVDHPLAPIQQRNLERAWGAKVLDRTGLILEIFGRRAQTREGRLQVELAHLDYQRSRLVRTWTHLERQRGGFGFLGGPGESQLEADRRMIRDRIAAIRKELDEVRRTRELHRGGRRRVPYPVIALVGYTNAGKSTLFNRLTGAAVLAKDQLFATLDPTMREVRLPSRRRVILSDTVGFISELPTMLVAAFRATLEEVVEADLLLHVIDVAHEESVEQRRDVEAVLSDLGIDAIAAEARLIEVWNKVDCLDPATHAEIANLAQRAPHSPVPISAATGEGLDRLLALLDERLGRLDRTLTITVPPSEGALLAWLHANAEVIGRRDLEEGGVEVEVRIDEVHRGRLMSRLSRAGLTPGA